MDEWLCKTLLLNVLLVGIVKGVNSTPCAFDVTDSNGTIISDSSHNYKNCSWIITAPRDHNIRLKFISFQLSDVPSLKLQSWIQVYDGKSTNDTLLGIYSGTRRPFTVQSGGRFLLVELITRNGEYSLGYFKGVFTSATTIDKPKIAIGIPFIRTVPGHIVRCSAEGTPPIQMSLLKDSTPFAYGTGMVWAKIYEEGTYTCVATNKAGSGSRDFPVTLTDCENKCLRRGTITYHQVDNVFDCTDTQLPADFLKCIPTTATTLILKGTKIRNIPPGTFLHMAALKYLNLAKNELQNTLTEDIFSSLVTLQYLDLSSNKIQDLPTRIFARLSSLSHLLLLGNKIQQLPAQLFSNQWTLKRLELNENEIHVLPPGIFSNLSKLEILYV